MCVRFYRLDVKLLQEYKYTKKYSVKHKKSFIMLINVLGQHVSILIEST